MKKLLTIALLALCTLAFAQKQKQMNPFMPIIMNPIMPFIMIIFAYYYDYVMLMQ